MNRTLAPDTTEATGAPASRPAVLRFVVRHLDRATILGILLLVVLVTLPRLRGLAIQENELDALRTLGILGGEVFAADHAGPDQLGDLFAAAEGLDSALERRLADTRVLDDGQRIVRYGYLFELTGDAADPAGRGLRAWPVEEGRTGQGAFWLNADLELRGNANREARWSGAGRPPVAGDVREWRSLELPRSRRDGI